MPDGRLHIADLEQWNHFHTAAWPPFDCLKKSYHALWPRKAGWCTAASIEALRLTRRLRVNCRASQPLVLPKQSQDVDTALTNRSNRRAYSAELLGIRRL